MIEFQGDLRVDLLCGFLNTEFGTTLNFLTRPKLSSIQVLLGQAVNSPGMLKRIVILQSNYVTSPVSSQEV